jgi:hypothetical protein
MNELSVLERHDPMSVEARLATKQAAARVAFDLIGCLDGSPAEWVIPWFKAIGRQLAIADLSWRDVAGMLRESSRKNVQNFAQNFEENSLPSMLQRDARGIS